jgi:chromosome segregation ATPase
MFAVSYFAYCSTYIQALLARLECSQLKIEELEAVKVEDDECMLFSAEFIQELQEKLRAKESGILNTQGELLQWQQHAAAADAECEQLGVQLEGTRWKLDECQTELHDALGRELEVEEEEVRAQEARVSELEGEVGRQQVEAGKKLEHISVLDLELKACQQQLGDSEQRNLTLEGELSVNEEKRVAIKSQLRQAVVAIADLEGRCARLAVVDKELRDSQEQVSYLQSQHISDLESELAAARQHVAELKGELAASQQARVELMGRMVEDKMRASMRSNEMEGLLALSWRC